MLNKKFTEIINHKNITEISSSGRTFMIKIYDLKTDIQGTNIKKFDHKIIVENVDLNGFVNLIHKKLYPKKYKNGK